MKVLVVDDSRIIRSGLRNVLQFLGHEVVAEAECGYDAVKFYKEHVPDLVTMDITMPMRKNVKNGVEALQKIIELDKHAKIIMITSHGEEDLVMDSIRSGAKGYILKPLTEEKVITALERVFPEGWMPKGRKY